MSPTVAPPILPNRHNQHSPTTRTRTKESIRSLTYLFIQHPPWRFRPPLLVKCRILATTAAVTCEGRRQRRVLAVYVIVKSFVGEQDEVGKRHKIWDCV